MEMAQKLTDAKKPGLSLSNTTILIPIILGMLAAMRMIKADYLSAANLLTLGRTLSIYTLVGFAQMASMSGGGMNLSVGAVGAMSAVLSGLVMEKAGAPTALAIAVGITAALLCGIVNGLLIYRNGGVGVASFLVTLATSSVFTGIVLTITQSKPYYDMNKSFLAVGNTTVFIFPTSLLIALLIAALLFFFYRKTRAGKQILAFGANSKAASLYGVSKLRTVLMINVLSALLAGAAGLFVVMRIGSAQPDIGTDWMLMSFSAALIGGCSMNGGRVQVWGTVLGALIITIVENSLVHLKVDIYWNQLINGAIILIVVALKGLRRFRRRPL